MSDGDQFPPEVLLSLERDGGPPLRVQLERTIREAIRARRLHPGTRLPATRSLAGQLGVSRGLVVDAYEQLAAEGYLSSRQGSGTRVAAGATAPQEPEDEVVEMPRLPYDFQMGVPDPAAFPRERWQRSMRSVLRRVPDRHLGHPDPRGAPELRETLAAHLGRVRGVVTSRERVLVCTGFWQGLGLLCRALRSRGATRLAMEDPSAWFHRMVVQSAGLEPVPVPVDDEGMRVHEIDADAVLVTPAHQFPTGVVLSPDRRNALLAWAEEHDALVIEDDYDSEYRFDREPVGALQGLAPERVAFGGSASKTLSPALRLGWVAFPGWIANDFAREKTMQDAGSPVLEQLALADFIERGELDRHLRRMRPRYRRRRDALVEAVAEHMPGSEVRGVAAGLHAFVALPESANDRLVAAAARERGVGVEAMSSFRFGRGGPPGLLLGYASLPEEAIRRGIAELGRAWAALA